MIKNLKCYENQGQMHEFCSPAVDVANVGIVEVINLHKIRIDNPIKFKTNNYRLQVGFNIKY